MAKVSTLIRALPERKELEITFPRVEGFVSDVRQRIKVNLKAVPYLPIDPAKAPTEVVVKPMAGYRLGRPDRLGPGKSVIQDRNPFHREKRLQPTVYEIAAEVTQRLKNKRDDWGARHILFPQVLKVVWEYVEHRVVPVELDLPLEDIALLKYKQAIVDRLTAAVEPDEEAGEAPLLPIIKRFRSVGSTAEVMFRTVRPEKDTAKSHISHVVLDTATWEQSVAFRLEKLPEVESYARNDHLDLTIPYEWMGGKHEYRPDYVVRYRTEGGEVRILLEVKGFESEQDRQKETAAKRWVKAVNRHGELGRWAFALCKLPGRVGGSAILDRSSSSQRLTHAVAQYGDSRGHSKGFSLLKGGEGE